MGLGDGHVPRVAALVTLLVLLPLGVRAQTGTTSRRTTTTLSPGAGDMLRGEMEREMLLREIDEIGAPARKSGKDARLLYEQMSEDFTRIQIINNELVRLASRDEALDPAFVARAAAEIRKRAQRLQINMALPEPDKDGGAFNLEQGAGSNRMKATLLGMGKLIAAFAHNPVFKQSGVVDAQLSAKARGDLDAIIEVSGRVTKECEKLSMAAKK